MDRKGEPTLQDVVDQLQGLRDEVRLLALRCNGPLPPGHDDLLAAIFAASGPVYFSSLEVITRCRGGDARLRHAVIAACGSLNTRKLGHVLAALEGESVHGLELWRVGSDRDGNVWGVRLADVSSA